jgi:Fic family protein
VYTRLSIIIIYADYKQYEIRVVSCSQQIVEKHHNNSSIRTLIKNRLDKICDEYNKEINDATNTNDKISIICKTIQRIEQLHPFKDGNMRTCYILLNRLLHEEEMPFTLLINPNRFDGFTLNELTSFVIEGQSRYLKLITQGIVDLTDDYLIAPPKIESNIIIQGTEKETTRFIEILNNNHTKSRGNSHNAAVKEKNKPNTGLFGAVDKSLKYEKNTNFSDNSKKP